MDTSSARESLDYVAGYGFDVECGLYRSCTLMSTGPRTLTAVAELAAFAVIRASDHLGFRAELALCAHGPLGDGARLVARVQLLELSLSRRHRCRGRMLVPKLRVRQYGRSSPVMGLLAPG